MSITKTLCEAMGKQVGVAKDSPGFVSNRLLMPYINEAIGVLADGVASKEDIDKVINATTPKPMVSDPCKSVRPGRPERSLILLVCFLSRYFRALSLWQT